MLGLHYSGMAATSFGPSRAGAAATPGVAISCLVTTIIVVSAFMILGLAISTSLLDRRYSAQAIALQAATTHYQKFLRQVIDTNPHLIFVKDWDGVYVLANEAVAAMYGTKVENLVGKRDADFNPNSAEVDKFLRDDREVMLQQRAAFISEEPATDAKTGETRWFQTVKVPLFPPMAAPARCSGSRPTSPNVSSWKSNSARLTRWRRWGARRRRGSRFQQRPHHHPGPNRVSPGKPPREDARRGDVLEIQEAADRAAAFTRQLLAFSRRQLLQPEVLDLNGVIAGMEMMAAQTGGRGCRCPHQAASRSPANLRGSGPTTAGRAQPGRECPGRHARGGTLLIETATVELDEHYPRQHPTAKPGVHVVLAVTDTDAGWIPPRAPGSSSRSSPPRSRAKAPGWGSPRSMAS